MEYRILGPLEVADEGEPVPPGRPKERLVLAVLLLHANEFVARERLIDELWGESPPPTARKAVNVYVSQLRKTLARDGHDPITTADGGYRLRVDPDELDAARLRQLLAAARERASAGELEAAAELLREALALWRGPTLAGLMFESHGRDEVAQLDEFRLTALMDRVDCDLALGRHEQVLGELHVLVGEHPLRERLRAQLMLALYRADRQAEALEAYQQARQTLVEELGIEPSPALQRLQQGILRHDPSLETASGTAAANGLAPTRPFREQGTALDEQPAHWLRVRVHWRYLAAAALVVLAAAAGLTAVATRAGAAPHVVPNSLVRLDPKSGKVISVVPVGVEPGRIAVTPTAIWTANYGDRTVSRYDLRTHTVQTRGGFGGGASQPYDIVADADGNVWVSGGAETPSVTRLAAGTGGTSTGPLYPSKTETIHVPGPGAGYEALGAGYLWLIVGGLTYPGQDDRLSLIDLASNQVVSSIRLGSSHSTESIAFGDGAAWIGSYQEMEGPTWLSVIRAGSDKVESFRLESDDTGGPLSIAVGAGGVWVLTCGLCNSDGNRASLLRFDPETRRVVAQIHISGGSVAAGSRFVWVVPGPAGATGSVNGVTQIDSRTNRVVRTIHLGDKTKGPCGIAAAPNAVWVAMGDAYCDTVGQ
jgi:DNA-binding SARP family transcriptional activator